MTPKLAEVLDAARALSRSERAEIAHELIATLETTDEFDEARYADLKEAVAVGIEQIERGEVIHVPHAELDEYIRGLGREATDRVARKSA